jgi:hypothetical protein
VAPVTRGGARHWPVYLPNGTWFDFWTHDRYAGGGWVELDAPLERMPLLVRGGAIVPLGPPLQHTHEPSSGTLRLLVYPEGTTTFMLYEDDGQSRDYEVGAFALSRIRCSAADDAGITLRVDAPEGQYAGKPPSRTIVVQLYLPRPPGHVELAGSGPLPRLQAREAVESAASGWWHDGAHFLWLAVRQTDTPVEIEVTPSPGPG